MRFINEHKLYLGFVLGGIITLSGVTRAVESRGTEDYSVNNVPGSPGKSSGDTNIETDIKANREAVHHADVAHEQAITSYGRNSPEAKEAGRKLDKKHTQLEQNLYEHGQVPGSKYPTQKMSSQQEGKSTPMAPIRQVEF